jgi:lysine 6-dehydrogenase
MKKIIVLGAGMVGRAMAIDLAKDYAVTSADIGEENLNRLKPFGITTIQADLTDKEKIKSIIADQDLVIGAVPGFMG